MREVLLLNHDGNPLTLWPLSTLTWQQAIKALFLEKVTVLRSYDDWICHSQHISIPVPSVVMMNRYHNQKGTVNFTRRNVFLRDRFHCQYCQRHFSSENLTIDHVIPKSKGGVMRWKNVVTAFISVKNSIFKAKEISIYISMISIEMPDKKSNYAIQQPTLQSCVDSRKIDL